MGNTNLLNRLLMLSLLFIRLSTVCAQTCCDKTSYFELVEKNDSTIELCISIDGFNGKTDFYRVNNEDSPLPKFQGRYKDCLLFMYGYGQHFRLLIVFQVINGAIIREDYEHTMCLEPDNEESYLFFYDGQPIKMTYNNKNFKVKFKKLRNSNKYNILKGRTIVSCKNKFYID